MKLRLTREQMLAEWKMRRHLEPPRTDAVWVRGDGPAVDAYCEAEMRSRYVRLLATAPIECLVTTDVTLSASLKRMEAGRAVVTLPEGTVRVAEVKLPGWERNAEIITDRHDPRVRLQGNRFSCGGTVHPVAVWTGGNAMELFSMSSPMSSALMDRLLVVLDEGSEVYAFDERAWEMLMDDNY